MSVDILLIVLCATSVGTVVALTARFPLFSVPWLNVIFEPFRYGGASQVALGTGIFILWLVAGNLICLAFAYALSNIALPIQKVYDFVGSDHQADPGAFTIAGLTTVYYLFLCAATKKYTENISNNPPVPEILSEENTRKIEETFLKKIDSPLGLPKLVTLGTLALPYLLHHIYSYFYFGSGILIDGLFNKLLDDFGSENVAKFFDQHPASTNRYLDREMQAIRSRFELEPDRELETHCLLMAKLRHKNYHVTKCHLENYIRRSHSSGDQVNQRAFERIFLNKALNASITTESSEARCKIIERSAQWVGCYLSTKLRLQENEECTVDINGYLYRGKVKHRNCMHKNKKIYRGYGVQLYGVG